MNYTEVLVAGAAYHGGEALTYSNEQPLDQGSIVVVPLRNRRVLGVVINSVSKPSFAVKSILEPADLPPLPKPLIELMAWMKSYYPSSYGIITQQFMPQALPPPPVDPARAPPLSSLPLPLFLFFLKVVWEPPPPLFLRFLWAPPPPSRGRHYPIQGGCLT